MTGSVSSSFRRAVLRAMPVDWMTASDIALRVGAADYAVRPSLRALWRSGRVSAKRRPSDGQILYRPKHWPSLARALAKAAHVASNEARL